MGHMIIRILVYADSEEDAFNEAQNVFDSLCGDGAGSAFDYYNTFDGASAIERWGEIEPVTKICLDFGSKECGKCVERFHCYTTQMNTELEKAMQETKRDFLEELGEVKKYLATHTDDQLFEEDWFKFHCSQVGQDSGPQVRLYDQDSEGIRTHKHLDNVLNKWGRGGKPDPELRDKSLYLIPADVHY